MWALRSLIGFLCRACLANSLFHHQDKPKDLDNKSTKIDSTNRPTAEILKSNLLIETRH